MRGSELCSTELPEAIKVGKIHSQVDGYCPRLSFSRCRSVEQLQYLLELGFICPQIARVLGVSLSTVLDYHSIIGLGFICTQIASVLGVSLSTAQMEIPVDQL